MKKNILLIAFIFTCQFINAQTPAATPIVPDKKINATPPVELNKTYYCCQSCDYTAIALRSCPLHQSLLIKVGNWYCPLDGKSHINGGKCPDDKTVLVRMEMKFKTTTPKPEELKKAEPIKK